MEIETKKAIVPVNSLQKPQENSNAVIKGDAKAQAQLLEDEYKTTPFPAPLPIASCPKSTDGLPKTGTGLPMLSKNPEFITDVEPYEPISDPQENILEESLKKETERIAGQENLLNRVVYDCIDPSPYLEESEFSEDLPPFYPVKEPEDTTLVFESRFESGNLRRAVQVYEFEYDLILKPDYNTRGNTQWFYFSVSNTKLGHKYRFNIINMMKPDSLYNFGMKPCVYSEIDSETRSRGWVREGTDICYYQNNMRKKSGGYFYTLTFSLSFNYNQDTVYIAHCYPYTYSDLTKYLGKLTSDPKKRNRVRKKLLCHTIAGNACECLTITNFNCDTETMKARKGVAVFGRVHPGETNASWMMKGFLDYITGPTLDAKILRDNFIFKVVPMLNPDGVINGSYRCGLAGVDLNRCWLDPSRKLHPTIFYSKSLIKQFMDENEVVLACDLHGHSRKKNIFMYGCMGRNRIREKIFPRLFERNSDIFSFADCMFGMQKAKESTARIVFYKELGIVNSYTLESSFCGPDFGKYSDFHFNIEHLQEVGHEFCDTILDFCDPDQNKVRMIMEELEIMFPPFGEEEPEEDNTDENDEEAKKKKRKKKPVVRKKIQLADKRKK